MKIIFADYDYLHTDYRVYKTAKTFLKNNKQNIKFEVLVIGITSSDDKALSGWEQIPVKRVKIFPSLPLKINMFIFWFKLFFLLLCEKKSNILYAHDIFPLLPVYMAAKIKRIPYIYDSHEFWFGVNTIQNRPLIKKFWLSYESFFIRRAKSVITVSESIAKKLTENYSIEKVYTMTNFPIEKKDTSKLNQRHLYDKANIGYDKKIILYQGGLLYNNGLDTVIKSFINIDNEAVLVLLGEGVEKKNLQKLVEELKLNDRVFFLNWVPHSDLYKLTLCAYAGLCLIKNSGLSFYYSTPNKMFEYIQAEIPQISSDFPEIKKIVDGYEIGITINPENMDEISDSINEILHNKQRYLNMKEKCMKDLITVSRPLL